MPVILDIDDDAEMSLAEYEDYILANVDLHDFDSLCESASALRRLANDRSFLVNCYHEELIDLMEGRTRLLLSPQSIYVVRRDDFFVRANIWLPASSDSEQRARDQKLYSYALPHDHNFDFVTVGYFGEGYKTDLYTYDRSQLTGYIGEQATLDYLGREQLSPGRIMCYQAGVDVHTQYEPDRVSLSLNLLPLNLKHLNTPQYVFDHETHCLSGAVSDQVASRLFLMDFFRVVNNEETVSRLVHVMKRHACPRTRGYALNVLEDIRPYDSEYFRSVCPTEDHKYARSDLVSASYNRA